MKRQSRILVVDDDPTSREAMALMLGAGRIDEVSVAESGEEALEMLDIGDDGKNAEPRFDAIVLDILMPGIDGIETCAAIRRTRGYRDIPIVLVTGLSEAESLNQAFVAGANDYLTKPVRGVELLARIRSAMRLKRELDRRRAREAELKDTNRELRLAIAPDYFDETNGLPSRAIFRLYAQQAAETDRKHGLLAFQIHDFDRYGSEAGEEAAGELSRAVAGALRSMQAPLDWTLASYGGGLFLAIAPGAARTELVEIGQQAKSAIAEMRMPHGNSADADFVRISVAAALGRGTELLILPSELIRSLELPFAAELQEARVLETYR